MESFQSLYTKWQNTVQDDSSSSLTIGKQDINTGIRLLESELDLPPLESTRTYTTAASTASYSLPQNFLKLKTAYVTISSQRYYAERIQDEDTWSFIKSNTAGNTSDYLSHIFIRPGSNEFEIYPTPSAGTYTLTFVYESFSKDLSANDYTTGTITTLANGGTAVTASGSTFTAAMAGRWFKTDDGEWYKIASFGTTTTLTLKHAYQGTSISSGTSSYTIGEMSRLPVALQEAPVSYAAWRYFADRRRDVMMAKLHENIWKDYKDIAIKLQNKHVSSIIPSARRIRGLFISKNPNAYPRNITNSD